MDEKAMEEKVEKFLVSMSAEDKFTDVYYATKIFLRVLTRRLTAEKAGELAQELLSNKEIIALAESLKRRR